MVSELSVHAVHLDEMRVLAESGSRKVLTDYPLTQGQPIEGLTSLELLLASLATCATNSVLALLKRKMKQSVTGLDVYARGLRCEEHPTVLTEISLEFVISGKVDPEAVRKSLRISADQLCPVWNMLKGTTPINATFRIIP